MARCVFVLSRGFVSVEEGVVPIAQEPSSEGESDSRHQDESEDFLGPNSLGIRSGAL